MRKVRKSFQLMEKNIVIESHDRWLLVDISTKKYPHATMAVDKDVWNDYDGGRVFAARIGSSKYIYAKTNVSKGKVCSEPLFHHLVVAKVSGYDVDHKRQGTMHFVDNRIANLRLITHRKNGMNASKKINNTSGVTGVSWDKSGKKWEAYIHLLGKKKSLGRYNNIEFAIGARRQAEMKYFGEYAYSQHN